MARVWQAPARFVHRVSLSARDDTGRYPFTLPAVAALTRRDHLSLRGGVCFIVGENGSGKSTLVEALAAAAGMNAEGAVELPVRHPGDGVIAGRPPAADLRRPAHRRLPRRAGPLPVPHLLAAD